MVRSRLTVISAGTILLITLISAADLVQSDWKAPELADTLKNPYPAKWGDKVVSQPVLDDGDRLYKTYCLSCHGAKGDGSGAPGMTFAIKPANFHDARVKEQTDGALFWKISEGRGQMPAYRSMLTEDQRWRLVAFLREIQNNPARTSVNANLVPPAGFKLPEGSSSSVFPLPKQILNAYRSERQFYSADTVLTGLNKPWSMAFLPDNSMLIAERTGGLRLVRQGKLIATPVSGDIPSELRDVKLHPDFENNRLVYLSYYQNPVRPDGGYTVLMRGRLDGDRLVQTETLYKAGPFRQSGFWYGSKITFDKKDFVYFTVGISGSRENAQDLSMHAGKTMRLNDDGTIPDDNPFAGKPGILPEIYTYGHRMHEGMAMDPETGQIFLTEFGELGGDELNILKPGGNYGWPQVTYSLEYTGKRITADSLRADVVSPLAYWKMAPSDLVFYHGNRYPGWKGSLFIGAIFDKYLARLEQNKLAHPEKLLENTGRIRDVKVGVDGYLYVLTEDNGLLIRILPLVSSFRK